MKHMYGKGAMKSNVKPTGAMHGMSNVKPYGNKQVRVGPIRTPFNKSITRKTSR